MMCLRSTFLYLQVPLYIHVSLLVSFAYVEHRIYLCQTCFDTFFEQCKSYKYFWTEQVTLPVLLSTIVLTTFSCSNLGFSFYCGLKT